MEGIVVLSGASGKGVCLMAAVLREARMSVEVDYRDHQWLDSEVAPLFSARVKQGHAPGSIMALFDANGIFYETSFGTFSDSTESPTIDTRYRIASCTKSFTAAALLLLRDRGLLSLDDPITRYVQEVNACSSVDHPVPTLRMLMSMRGGLITDDPWADRQESLSNDAFRTLLKQSVLYAHVPGRRFEYSNTGYALLGLVIESVSGLSYCEFVTQEFFQPLGLKHTTFDYRDVPSSKMATGYRLSNKLWEALPLTTPGAYSSIGGVISTVQDLSVWANWLNQAHRQEEQGADLLSQSSRREMQSIHCPTFSMNNSATSINGYGYGLLVEDTLEKGAIICHSGGYPGFSAHMRWSATTGIGVIAFENASYAGVIHPAREALTRVLSARDKATPTAPPDVPSVITHFAEVLISQLTEWDEQTLADICADNVVLDIPFAERQQQWRDVISLAGEIFPAAAVIKPNATGGFEKFEVDIPGAKGNLCIEAVIAPLKPYRLQTINIRHVEDVDVMTL